jgi:glutamine synthetase
MACKKCGKDKNKEAKSKKTKSKTVKNDLLYIMNPGCGWCTKADPVVEELIKEGYEITKLDITKPEQAERANEAKTKHNAQCGTPLFLDAETGNVKCGFAEKDILEKWAKGEEMPAPPERPQQPQQNEIETLKFEYIWLDGDSSKNIRSKTRYQRMPISRIPDNPQMLIRMAPKWSYDGSSTMQATTDNSDCGLSPVKIVENPMDAPSRINGKPISYLVLCEVTDIEGNAHETNTRSKLVDAVNKRETELRQREDKSDMFLVGFEQEYTIVDPITGNPIGWSDYDEDTPPPQGKYYCGVGADVTKGRKLAETHASLCNKVGVGIMGTNAEVMLSQWEFQTAPKLVLQAADDVIISRFLLQRIAEDMGLAISYNPKPVAGDWNGSGGHINFSTEYMRRESDIAYLISLCSSMERYHKESIDVYGEENNRRLTGNNETSSQEEFTWGEMDRGASIRIPQLTVQSGGKGHLEDRRPAANIDPYEAFNYLYGTIVKINEELLITT